MAAQSHPPADPSPAEQLEGAVLRITYQNPDNGYTVAKLAPEDDLPQHRRLPGGEIAAVGLMPGLEVGEHIRAEGEWTRDPRYGPQFKVRWFKPMLPTGARGIEAYLASGAVKGIGPVTARRIVRRFGDRAFEIMDNEINRLTEVPGIGRKTLKKIRKGWSEARGDRELVTFLGEHGVSPGVAARLRKVYGESALATVRANPYRLISDVRGIGFARADAIARKIGIPADSPDRIDAALRHALARAAEEGHTGMPRDQLEREAERLVEVPCERITERLQSSLDQGSLLAENLSSHPDSTAIFTPVLHQAERRAAEALRRLLKSPKSLPEINPVEALADFEQRACLRMADTQRQAVLTFVRRGCLILTGGPGTGKTTTIRAIIELFRLDRRSVKLAAPTGRAARRLSETAKLPAETIHRLLGFNAALARFGRDASNPVDADLVIIDEASMLDAPLAADLLDAIHPRTCLMIVGDEDQLPSVGPGQVLADLIAADLLPLVRLTEIFRQAGASQIIVNAHRINQGRLPRLQPPEGCTDPDFFFIEREDPVRLVDTIRTLLRDRIPRKFHLDPHHDVQILTPMRRGELGVVDLNEQMKQLLNPGVASGGDPSARRVFDVGDRVMQTSNNYDKLVFNGDVGHVLHADPESGEVVVAFDDRRVAYLSDEVDQLTLAYAITIHKSQGSEYPAVIIPVHTQHWIMLQRNLLYTAVTRARRLVCLVGTRRALHRAVANARRTGRFTALADFLQHR